MVALVATSFTAINCMKSPGGKSGGSNSSKSNFGGYSSPMAQSQSYRQNNFNITKNSNISQDQKSDLQGSASQSQHDKQMYANTRK